MVRIAERRPGGGLPVFGDGGLRARGLREILRGGGRQAEGERLGGASPSVRSRWGRSAADMLPAPPPLPCRILTKQHRGREYILGNVYLSQTLVLANTLSKSLNPPSRHILLRSSLKGAYEWPSKSLDQLVARSIQKMRSVLWLRAGWTLEGGGACRLTTTPSGTFSPCPGTFSTSHPSRRLSADPPHA